MTFIGTASIGAIGACGSSGESTFAPGSNTSSGGTSGGVLGNGDGGAPGCKSKTCAELGWACGYTVDECGTARNCADEGRSCGPSEVCVGGRDGQPTKCVANAGGGSCEICSSIPTCTGKPQKTRITGRVISPGRTDANTGNQVGVPNAIVYIPQSADPAKLPPIPSGIEANKTSCDRCNEQDLGRVLAGAVTDAKGNYTLEGNIPVGKEFLLVVKAGRFRRAVKHTIPATGECTTTALPTALPANPTRLPRTMSDGLAVNMPRIAITTGEIDAMECVFEKMGIAHSEFSNPGPNAGGTTRVHLYRGGRTAPGRGAYLDANTPHDSLLYDTPGYLTAYDLVVADCEGLSLDVALQQGQPPSYPQRDKSGARVRDYVNRGGRMFLSHLSFTWLHGNDSTPYSAANPQATGLAQAGTWDVNGLNTQSSGRGRISTEADRTRKSPRIQNFADWMVNEGAATQAAPHEFDIVDPRSQALTLGSSSEEFVFQTDGSQRVQQYSFNTPYGAPAEAACGRVAYSGFHVVSGGGDAPYANVVFPSHCSGDLSSQEKVLLYMLFDVGACVGADPLPPSCTPVTCKEIGAACGFTPDGCGNILDCGPCGSTPK